MFRIALTGPKGQTNEVECTIDQCTIGKGDDNLVVIRGWSVGKKHATIRQRPDGFYIEDHGGMGGTEVNGKNIDGNYGPYCPSQSDDPAWANAKGYCNIKPKNEWLHEVNWDLVVFDEYHFGAWRETAKELFAEENPVGKSIRIGEWRMRVIGVNGPRGTHLGQNLDEVSIGHALISRALFVGLERVVVDTYQAVSGTGGKAIAELEGQVRAHVAGEPKIANVYPHPIAFNALPEIDVFLPNGYTKEEWKVVEESRKILHLPDLRLSCTAVRIPVFVAHSEAVHVETRDPITPERARELFAAVPGLVVRDDPAEHVYPLATEAAGRDEVFVGRVRQDPSVPGGRGLALWIVSDNLRKGAATNAVEIAEVIASRGWVAPAAARSSISGATGDAGSRA